MKIYLTFILFFIFTYSVANANTYIETTINGYNAKIIKYNTSSGLYNLQIGLDTKSGSSLREIMTNVNGISGVNGVFECPKDYSTCGGKNYTINERYIQGEKIATYESTGDRVVFAWNKDYEAFLFQTDSINKNKESEIWEGFANHPLLLKNGIPQTQIYWEKGLIDYKMKSRGTKNFICSDKLSKNIYFGLVKNIDIDHLAIAIKELGCYNAINLDAGYSTAMIYNGEYISGPGREILDGVFIVPKDLNISEIDNKIKIIIKKIVKKIKIYNTAKKIKYFENLELKLEKAQTNFYKKNTKLIKKENLVGEIDIIGKETTIKNKEDIEKIYTINLLKTYSGELKNLYIKIAEINKFKKLDLDINLDLNFQ